jgi:hypothetical protein
MGAFAWCFAIVFAGAVSATAAEVKPTHKTIRVGTRTVKLTLFRPAPAATAPPFIVIFASGDGGLRGGSKDLLVHLGAQHYWVVGFSSPEALKGIDDESKGEPNYAVARDRFASIISQAKQALSLPDQTPIVIVGMSRGANVVVAAAGDAVLRAGMTGAVAVALTREFDDLTIPDSLIGNPGIETDDQGRLQTYPSLQRLGAMRLAVIQSTNDSYVPSAESRQLLGPDTSTRRLYEIESKNHSFGGGRDALVQALDDAMTWVAQRP